MTATMSETRRVVESYFNAWTTHRVGDAYALLADDLKFAGPTASYESAAAFRPALEGFAKMTRQARLVDLIVEGDRAALLYDCELPEPVGLMRISSFFRVARGKIVTYELVRCDEPPYTLTRWAGGAGGVTDPNQKERNLALLRRYMPLVVAEYERIDMAAEMNGYFTGSNGGFTEAECEQELRHLRAVPSGIASTPIAPA
jgi:SnoaL-like protein